MNGQLQGFAATKITWIQMLPPLSATKQQTHSFTHKKRKKKKKQQTHSYIYVVTLARPPEKDWFIKPICKELTLIMPTAYISR
jgi:hypothetical protein